MVHFIVRVLVRSLLTRWHKETNQMYNPSLSGELLLVFVGVFTLPAFTFMKSCGLYLTTVNVVRWCFDVCRHY